jgi:hypothetical protein
MKQRKIVVIGGGTMVHVTPHFSLCAPAYGKVAKSIHDKLCAKGGDVESVLVLTKMAQTKPQLSPLIETNDDLSQYVDTLLEDDSVKCIVVRKSYQKSSRKDLIFSWLRLKRPRMYQMKKSSLRQHYRERKIKAI